MSKSKLDGVWWYFNRDAKRRCSVCEGSGTLRGGHQCGFCGGGGRGEFRYNWGVILPTAAEIVRSYEATGVTLRQLFYRLVAKKALPNTPMAYNNLSTQSARARREGWFPALIDQGRDIHRYLTWSDHQQAIDWLGSRYRHERDEQQPYAVYLGVEKAGMRSQLMNWFGDPLGLPVIALGGYASQTLKDQVYADVVRQVARYREEGEGDRESVFIYAGDFDASGEDIPRDFLEQTDCFDHVIRVALTPEQVEEFKLPPQPGKHSDSRSKKFAEKYVDLFEAVYGMDLVQIELDAIPPDDLKAIYQAEIDNWFDQDAHEAATEREAEERDLLLNGEMAREPAEGEVWFDAETGLRFQVTEYEPAYEGEEARTDGHVEVVSVRQPEDLDGWDPVTFRRRFKPLDR